MRIAIIGQKGIPAKSGGVERHVEELSTRLAKSGHQVFVYARNNYNIDKIKNYQGVNIINLPSIGTKHLDAISHTFLACLDLFKRDVDIIHFHSIGPSFFIWLAKLLKPRTPILATFHTKCYEHKKWGWFARLSLELGEAVCCIFADQVITVSKSLYKYVKENYKINPVYIPNGVPKAKNISAKKISKIWGLKENNYILTVSRLIRHKGIQYLIEAYQSLKTGKKLVIVGDGSFTDDYVKELKKMAGTDKNIIFTGNQTGQILAELYSNAAIFVQPSESEGLSIALLEAMSYGKAIITSDIPENIEAIESYGLTFKNKKSSDLKGKIFYLLKRPALIKKLGLQSRKRAALEYNWEKVVCNIERSYQAIIQEKRRAKIFHFRLAKKFIG